MNKKLVIWILALVPLCSNAFTVTENNGLDAPFGATTHTSIDLIFLPLEEGANRSEISLELFFCCNVIDPGESFAISYSTGFLTGVGKGIVPPLVPLESILFDISDIFISSENTAQLNISPSTSGNGVFVTDIELSVTAIPLPATLLLFLSSLLLIFVPKLLTNSCTGSLLRSSSVS